jgi:hypothetical protein
MPNLQGIRNHINRKPDAYTMYSTVYMQLHVWNHARQVDLRAVLLLNLPDMATPCWYAAVVFLLCLFTESGDMGCKYLSSEEGYLITTPSVSLYKMF